MFEVSKTFEFDAAHRLMFHPGKCKSLHGHRYLATVVLAAPELAETGMLVDFGVLKEIVGGWIDYNWDHNVILEQGDPLIKPLEEIAETEKTKKPYIIDRAPTAEVMAEILRTEANQALVSTVVKALDKNGEFVENPQIVRRAYIRETPSSWAGVYGPNDPDPELQD